jgi:hypothetical protein
MAAQIVVHTHIAPPVAAIAQNQSSIVLLRERFMRAALPRLIMSAMRFLQATIRDPKDQRPLPGAGAGNGPQRDCRDGTVLLLQSMH